MTVVDASVLVAYFHDQDHVHQSSMIRVQRHLLADGLMYAPRLVLAEVAGAIARRTSDPALAQSTVRQLLALPEFSLLPVTDALTDAAASPAADLRLRGADAVYVAAAAELGAPPVTWDGEQLERGSRRIVVQRPDQA